MVLKWTVVAIDRSSGSPVEQDITARHSYPDSQFQSAGQEQPKTGSLDVSFLYTESYNLQTGQEWWAGFRDTVTHAWSLVDSAGDPALVYGGYVTINQGGAVGPQHTIKQALGEYALDFETTDIIVWPDLATYPTPYPDGYSATDWLVGTAAGGKPFDGIIAARLASTGGYLLDGVDPAFDSIIFGASTGVKPGVPLKEAPLNGGLWGFVDLRSALDDIIAAVHVIDDTLDPVAFVEAVIDPGDATKIRPRFRFVNRADVSATPVAVFASDPGAGEWLIEEPFSHLIAAPGSRQRVVVWGPGTADGTPTGPPLFEVAYNGARPVQPTVYQTDPGRSGKPYYSEDITSTTQALAEANKIEATAWAPLRTLRFRTKRPTLPGETVHVRIPPEGIDENFRVADVSTVPGVIRCYDITIGIPMPDFNALLQRRARKEHALQQLAALGLPLPGGQTGTPGAARRQPIHSTPQNPNGVENVVQPGNPDTSAIITRPGWSDPAGAPPFFVQHQIQSQVWNATGGYWEARFWSSGKDGRPHPYIIDLGYIAVNGTYGTHVLYDCYMRYLDLKGTGTVELLKNGVHASGPYTVSGTRLKQVVATAFAEGDDVHVVVTAVSGAGVSIKVWEGEN